MDAAAAADDSTEQSDQTLGDAAAEQSDPRLAAPSPQAPGWTGARGTPTRLLLLRHGQTELSVQRRYSGRGNPALTEVGRRQADAAARYLAQRGGISAVISSPLQRAYDTAASAAKALGLDVTVDDDLIETDFGAWEGLTFAEAAERDPNCTVAGCATPVPPAGRRKLRCGAQTGCLGHVTGSSPHTEARRCWWCRT